MMLHYQCGGCGATFSVYALVLDCPFCHVEYYNRQRLGAATSAATTRRAPGNVDAGRPPPSSEGQTFSEHKP